MHIGRMLSSMGDSFEGVFGIDYRSLAVLRIALASLVLLDLVVRLREFTAHYSFEHGIARGLNPGAPWSILLDALAAVPYGTEFLFALCGASAALLLLGRYTRTASALTWGSLFLIQQINPFVFGMHDPLLRILLFFGIFLPWGRAYALDAFFSDRKLALPRVVTTPWTALLIIQITYMYLFAGVAKLLAPAWSTGHAVYYVLSLYPATDAGRMLLAYPDFLAFLAVSIPVLQLIVPVLLFSPFKTASVRIMVVVALVAMHAAYTITLHIGFFSAVVYAALIAFVPSSAWDALLSFVRRCVRVRNGTVRSAQETETESGLVRPTRRFTGVVLAGAVFLALVNLESLHVASPLPSVLTRTARAVGLHQQWTMFTGVTPEDNGWFRIEGTLRDGRSVNAFNPGQPLPEDMSGWEAFGENSRWRRYFITIRNNEYPDTVRYFLEHLCERWNSAYGANERMARVDVSFITAHVSGSFPPTYGPEVSVAWSQGIACPP